MAILGWVGDDWGIRRVGVLMFPVVLIQDLCKLINLNINLPLKAVDTVGNCQRLAFTVGASQHMHKITNL